MVELIHFSQLDVLNKIIKYLDKSLDKNLKEYQYDRSEAKKSRDYAIDELEEEVSELSLEFKFQGNDKKNIEKDEWQRFILRIRTSDGMLEEGKSFADYFDHVINKEEELQLKVLQLDCLKKTKKDKVSYPYVDRAVEIQKEHAMFKKNFEHGYCQGISLLWTYGVYITKEVEAAAKVNSEFTKECESLDQAKLVKSMQVITAEINEKNKQYTAEQIERPFSESLYKEIDTLKQKRLLLQNEITKRVIAGENIPYYGLDNDAWFNHCIHHILDSETVTEDATFDLFINNIQYLHCYDLPLEIKNMKFGASEEIRELKQSDVEILLSGSDTTNRNFGTKSICWVDDINDLEIFIKKNPGTMIYLAIKKHVISACCDENGVIEYFDPNFGIIDRERLDNAMSMKYGGATLLYCKIIEPGYTGETTKEMHVDFTKGSELDGTQRLVSEIIKCIEGKGIPSDSFYDLIANYYRNNNNLFELTSNNHSGIIQALSFNGYEDTLIKLLKHDDMKKSIKKFLSSKDKFGNTPVHLAAEQNKVDFLRLLLDNYDSEIFLQVDDDGNTPVDLAIIKCNKDVLKMMVKKFGGNIYRYKNSFLEVPPSTLKLLDVLIREDQLEKNNMKCQEAIVAVQVGDAIVLSDLLKRFSFEQKQQLLNSNVENSKTIIDIVLENKSFEMFKEILRYSTDEQKQRILKTKNKDGNTIIDIAVKARDIDLLREILNLSSRLQKQEILSPKNNDGETIVHIAASKGDLDVIRNIFTKFISPDDKKAFFKRDKYGDTIAHSATCENHKGVLHEIFKHFVTDDERQPFFKANMNGDTIAHIAAIEENLDLLKDILSFASEKQRSQLIRAKNKNGVTLFHMLAKNGNVDVLRNILISSPDELKREILTSKNKAGCNVCDIALANHNQGLLSLIDYNRNVISRRAAQKIQDAFTVRMNAQKDFGGYKALKTKKSDGISNASTQKIVEHQSRMVRHELEMICSFLKKINSNELTDFNIRYTLKLLKAYVGNKSNIEKGHGSIPFAQVKKEYVEIVKAINEIVDCGIRAQFEKAVSNVVENLSEVYKKDLNVYLSAGISKKY